MNPAEMRGSVFLYFVMVSPRSFLNRLKLLLVSSFHLAIRFIKTLPAKTLLFLSHRTTNIHHQDIVKVGFEPLVASLGTIMVSFLQGSRHGAGHLHRLWTNHGDGLDAGNPSND